MYDNLGGRRKSKSPNQNNDHNDGKNRTYNNLRAIFFDIWNFLIGFFLSGLFVSIGPFVNFILSHNFFGFFNFGRFGFFIVFVGFFVIRLDVFFLRLRSRSLCFWFWFFFDNVTFFVSIAKFSLVISGELRLTAKRLCNWHLDGLSKLNEIFVGRDQDNSFIVLKCSFSNQFEVYNATEYTGFFWWNKSDDFGFCIFDLGDNISDIILWLNINDVFIHKLYYIISNVGFAKHKIKVLVLKYY